MEYTPGIDVLTSLTSPREHQISVVSLLNSLLNSVQSYKSIGCSHMDIKPENIIWDHQTGKITLIDFEGMVKHPSLGMRKLKTITGSDPYMSPETLDRGLIHCNTDFWSVGLTVLSIQLRTNPIQSNTVSRQSLREYSIETLKEHECSPELIDRVSSLLYFDPDMRVDISSHYKDI